MSKTLKVAIMQPYFFPYIGYFQLIAAVDVFVVYDNIKYTKKGWINRNRILQNGKDVMLSLPLKNDSDYLDICDRELSSSLNKSKLLGQIKEMYRRAPYFPQTFALIEGIINYEDVNLFGFLHNSLIKICEHLNISTEIRVSSTLEIEADLIGQDKVLALCKAVNTSMYVNAIGGLELYSKETFSENGIDLKFIRSMPFTYPQFDSAFVPWLSIIDVMMFNPLDVIKKCIETNYELI